VERIISRSGIFGFLVFIVSAQNALTQPYSIRFQHLSVEQGLSTNYVYAITQDKSGFMWIATSDGLNRFDGHDVEVYRSKHGDENSLPSNEILCLFTDSRGIVWAGTGNGLAYYDDHANSFRVFLKNSKNKNSLAGNVINVINEDNRGRMWIGTSSGLCSFEAKNSRFETFVHSDSFNSISNNIIRDIKFDPRGKMWITTDNGLNCLDLPSMRFTSFFHDSADETTLSGNKLGKMAIDKDGNLWTFLWISSRLDCFDTKTTKCSHFTDYHRKHSQMPVSFLNSLFIDRSGRLWLGNNRTGLSVSLNGKDFYEFNADPVDPDKIHSNHIRGMYQDRSGMIWVATKSGAERFNPDESKFISCSPQFVSDLALTGSNVLAVTEDPSYHLWIGTSEGIAILDRSTGVYTNYRPNGPIPRFLHDSLNGRPIQALCCDRQGNIWIGMLGKLCVFNPRSKENFRVFYPEQNKKSLSGNNITSIVCDKNGDMLIASRGGGLSIYNSKSGEFTNFKDDSVLTLLNDQINVVFEDNRGIIWLGMRNSGLIKFDRSTGKLQNFTKKVKDTASLSATYVCSITQDHKGIIWIGTAGGLCRFDQTTQSFTTFSERHGLPNGRIMQLLVDDKDRIWMGTNRGISMLNESRTAFTNYDPSDGLQGWEFSESSGFKTHDGFFCYGGTNGFNMFRPDSIKKNVFIPPVMLRSIKIFDQPLNINSPLSILKSLRLSYKQNFFSFEFAALNYDHPEKNQYACQLIPFDKKMVQLGTSHSISYTNVPAGEYKLKVKASNNDGVWNETEYELGLSIAPPFWATIWFRTFVIILVLGVIFLLFRLREDRIKKEQARQTAINKEVAEIRMSALQSQMNPHFIFNSLNSIQHLISIREKEEAISYLSKFSRLIRKMLENSRETTVSVRNEVELLELYIQLEQLRFGNKFDYHIAVDERIDIENSQIPPLLIQPHVENAILHGLVSRNEKGNLWLSIEKNDGLLICKIEDNGIGRKRAHEIEETKISRHKSLGIKVTDERISAWSTLLDYKMQVLIEDLFEPDKSSKGLRQPSGTRVTISIPLKEED